MRRFINGFSEGFSRGIGFIVGSTILCVLLIGGALIADSLFQFSAGDLVSAAQINHNFQRLQSDLTTIKNDTQAPVGSIVGWHKNVQGPALAIPAGWVECNGGTVNDPDSPIDGSTIPNLNGDPGGGNSPGLGSAQRMFLRGGTSSGTGESDTFAAHTHGYESESWHLGWGGNNSSAKHVTEQRAGKNTAPAGGGETRPKNMSVVWIMRIK